MSTVAAIDNFRENVRKQCRRQKISQRELARRSGVHFVTVNRIFSGNLDPSIPLAERLAKALGIRLEKFLQDPT